MNNFPVVEPEAEPQNRNASGLDEAILMTYFSLIAALGIPGNTAVLFSILSDKETKGYPQVFIL